MKAIIEIQPVEVKVTEPQTPEIQVHAPTETIKIVDVGPQGPPGPTGAADSVREDLTLAETVGGHRLVSVNSDGNLVLADCRVLDRVLTFAGITVSAGAAGAQGRFQAFGPVTDSSLAVNSGPVYMGYDGAWTQEVPTEGAILQVGYGEYPNTIVMRAFQPIMREG